MRQAAVLLALATATVGLADDRALDARARRLWQLMPDQKFDEFAAAGDETMQKSMNAAASEGLWKQLEFKVGPFKQITSSRVATIEPYYHVSLTCLHERGEVVVRLVLDGQNRLSGLWLDKVEPKEDPAAALPPYVNKDAFDEKECVAAAARPDLLLPGTVSIPKGCKDCPAVVLVHGSGPNDRDGTVAANKPLRDLAWGLASQGIVVLRYDKRTAVFPNYKPAGEWTLEDETLADALAAARMVRDLDMVDDRRVFIVGHSLGAIAAPLLAKRDPRLAGVVLLAGSPRSLLDLLEDQVTSMANADGAISEQEQGQLAFVRHVVASVKAGKLDQVPPEAGLPAKYLAEMHALNVLGVAQGLKTPMLICQGGRDYQVTLKDFEAWKAGLAGRPNVTFELFEDVNHLFISGKGKSSPGEYGTPGHVSPAVIEKVAAWIKAQPPAGK